MLLDNINSAPQEVIERLNSLAEETPTLNVYESGKGAELRVGDGIHRDFRLIASANLQRADAQKLSSAFVNRAIVIRMQEIGHGAQGRLRQSDLFLLVRCAAMSVSVCGGGSGLQTNSGGGVPAPPPPPSPSNPHTHRKVMGPKFAPGLGPGLVSRAISQESGVGGGGGSGGVS